jgi:hypothetical protein
MSSLSNLVAFAARCTQAIEQPDDPENRRRAAGILVEEATKTSMSHEKGFNPKKWYAPAKLTCADVIRAHGEEFERRCAAFLDANPDLPKEMSLSLHEARDLFSGFAWERGMGGGLRRAHALALFARVEALAGPPPTFHVEVPEFNADGLELQPVVFRLLHFMSTRPRALLCEVYPLVWADQDVKENARKTAMKKANEALEADGKTSLRLHKDRRRPEIFWK